MSQKGGYVGMSRRPLTENVLCMWVSEVRKGWTTEKHHQSEKSDGDAAIRRSIQ